MNPKVKGKRYRSGDELVDMFKPNFMGQVGMRIMQRPQGGTSVFKDEDGNFDKGSAGYIYEQDLYRKYLVLLVRTKTLICFVIPKEEH